MKKYVIALDQGTTSSRAIIFDREQNIIGLAQKELAQRLHVTDKAVSRWETGWGLPDENPWALGLA